MKVAEPLAGRSALERFAGSCRRRERVIRSHATAHRGELQLARLADIAIDLFALTAVISRVQATIERVGEEAARHEIDIARQFSREAGARIEAHAARLGENRDERVRRIAARKAVETIGAPACGGRDEQPPARPRTPPATASRRPAGWLLDRTFLHTTRRRARAGFGSRELGIAPATPAPTSTF